MTKLSNEPSRNAQAFRQLTASEQIHSRCRVVYLALENLTKWLVLNVADVGPDMSPCVAAAVHGTLHANLESYGDCEKSMSDT